MTIKQAKEELKALDMTLRKRDGEYRVNFREGNEDSSYYTDDINDAVATAKHMRKAKDESQQRLKEYEI